VGEVPVRVLLNLQDSATLARVSVRTIQNWRKAGWLHPIPVRRGTRVIPAFDAQEVKAAALAAYARHRRGTTTP